MNIPRRMVVFLLCLVLVIVALTGCLGGGDDGGDQGDDGDSGDDGTGGDAGTMIVSQDDLPAGWYDYNFTQIYGYDYPAWQGDFGSVAIKYFSNSEDVINDSTEFLIVGVMDFDDTVAANYWYDAMYDAAGTPMNLGVGDEGFYINPDGDGSDVTMYFRNGDVCVVMIYTDYEPPSDIADIIDLAEIQNDKL
jgi:hypothetical protein